MFWRRRNEEARDVGPTTGEDRVMEQLSAYLDGELDEAETAEVDALLARDPSAAELLADLRLVRSAYGALGEVRAPRSFAIPAEAASAPRTVASPLALFRRTELFMRATAAVAALFFVVALVNGPSSETPVANFALDGTQSSMSAPAQESLRATEEGAAGSAGTLAAPEPATAEGGGTDGTDDTDDTDDTDGGDGTGGGAAGTMGALAAPSPEAANTGEASGGATSEGGAGGGLPEDASTSDMQGDVPPGSPGETSADSSRSAEELRPLPPGTELVNDSSQGVGGMVLGLGVVAGLLTALSVLVAWNRRSGDSTR